VIGAYEWALIAADLGLLFAAVIFLFIRQPKALSYVSTFGGVVEIIAGVNFGLYRRASYQAAVYHVRLDRIRKAASVRSTSPILEANTYRNARSELNITCSHVPACLTLGLHPTRI
jgi:hypothetical protein